MKLKKHTLSFIVALAVTFMAIESAVASHLQPPGNLTATVEGNKVTLTWDAVYGANGYYFYYGFGEYTGDYVGSIDVGNVTSIDYVGLPDGTYFVNVIAYDGKDVSKAFTYVSVIIGASDEFYQFKRMWPTLPQPWYFGSLLDVAIDNKGYAYITSNYFDMVMKFDPDGNFITKWGGWGSGDGQFKYISDIAVDSNGNVYVADSGNKRIQKFDSDGNFITKWGSGGSGDGQFSFNTRNDFSRGLGITVDSNGNVYVADIENVRIQKFDSDGNFITKWGSEGSGDGQFGRPRGISVDSQGNVYVADSVDDRIQKFDSNGNFITKWGSEGSGDGQFDKPSGIAVDSNGNVYVADSGNDRIQKFDSDGNFITKWFGIGSVSGQARWPRGIAVDGNGKVYVSIGAFSIQKFDSDGNFITKWGSEGSGDGQFNFPTDIAVDSSNNVYVADNANDRIQKFDSDGNFITKCGELEAVAIGSLMSLSGIVGR